MTYFKRRKSVRCDIERRDFDISKEVIKVIRIDHDLGQGFVSRAFSQHCAAVECDVLMFVTTSSQNTFINRHNFISLLIP